MLSGEIPRDQWTRFFDDFSKQHEGWIVDWHVLGEQLGDQKMAERLPLVGISADLKGGRPRIEVMAGDSPDAHVTWIIDTPKRVLFKAPEQPGHSAVEIESADGVTTVISFEHIDPEFEERQLPPKN